MKYPGFVGSNVGVYKSVYTKVISEKDFWVCRDTRCRVYLRSSCPDSKVDMRQGASVKGTAPQEEWHDCCSHTSSLLSFLLPLMTHPTQGRRVREGGETGKCERWHKRKKAFYVSIPSWAHWVHHPRSNSQTFISTSPTRSLKKRLHPSFFPSCLHCRSWAISSPNHLSNMLSCVSVCPLVHCCAHLMISAGEIPLFQGIPGLYLWASPT